MSKKKKKNPRLFSSQSNISEALSGAKLNYIEIEKRAYVILISSRKLKHYFQVHEIIVPSSQPLGDIFSNKEAS